MKYIRTKNGIYEICPTLVLWPSSIIKEADTIEKVCDAFVVFEIQRKFLGSFILHEEAKHVRTIVRKFNKAKTLYKKNKANHPNEEHYLYGAIWTDKGLNYVAKMNDKGELELLEEKK